MIESVQHIGTPELSTGPFSWTRPGETLTRTDPRLPIKSLTRPDPPICTIFHEFNIQVANHPPSRARSHHHYRWLSVDFLTTKIICFQSGLISELRCIPICRFERAIIANKSVTSLQMSDGYLCPNFWKPRWWSTQFSLADPPRQIRAPQLHVEVASLRSYVLFFVNAIRYQLYSLHFTVHRLLSVGVHVNTDVILIHCAIQLERPRAGMAIHSRNGCSM